MTKQAEHSIELYKGNHPETIALLLKRQQKSVVNELKEHFKAKDIDELALKLSWQ